MYRLLLVMVAVLVAVIQIAVWTASERRSDFSSRLARGGQSVTGKVTGAEGRVVDGRSNYVVNYQFQVGERTLTGEELLSLRQPDLPTSGANVTVFYDPADPALNTIQDPHLSLRRLATMKLLTLGFGAFTYAFLWVTWQAHKNEEKERALSGKAAR